MKYLKDVFFSIKTVRGKILWLVSVQYAVTALVGVVLLSTSWAALLPKFDSALNAWTEPVPVQIPTFQFGREKSSSKVDLYSTSGWPPGYTRRQIKSVLNTSGDHSIESRDALRRVAWYIQD